MSDERRPDAGGQDELAARLRELLAERGRATNGDVRSLLDGVPSLPERRSGRRASFLAAAAAVGLLVLGGAFVVGRLSVPGVGDLDQVGRGAFADDPRLAACESTTGPAAQAFEMTHAEWFPLYFPGWWRGAPELEVSDPALVVIGPEVDGGFLGAAPRADDPSPAPTRSPAFLMCVAVGAGRDATLHQYGPTWFDRIVPVLSDADVVRATHLDPDVLGDPAAWAFPERLAPCGGVTGNELYVFEANPLLDFPRYFPAAGAHPELAVDAPAIVVVYRDPLPIPRRAPGTVDPSAHDVCVILEDAPATPDHVFVPDVSLDGFHLRIDREENVVGPIVPGMATPAPTTAEPSAPVVTPQPAPAWAGDVTPVLECLGTTRTVVGLRAGETGSGEDPDQALAIALSSVRTLDADLPDSGYVVAADDPAARLYVRRSNGRIVAALAIVPWQSGATDAWVLGAIGACESSEFDPSVSTGRHPFGAWVDAAGDAVPSSELGATADCYGGTQVRLNGRLYVRTPLGGVDPSQLEASWKADVALPATAIDTRYRSGDIRLFRGADDKAIYVANGDRAERLPHVIGDEVVRTDCN